MNLPRTEKFKAIMTQTSLNLPTAGGTPALTMEAIALRLTALEQRVGVLECLAGPAAGRCVPGTALGEAEMQRRENAVVALAQGGRDGRLVCRFCGHALAGNKGLLAHLKRSHAAELAGLSRDFGR